MKITFESNDASSYIQLIPETVQEANDLMEFAANSRVEPANISYSFLTTLPRAEVYVRKVKSNAKTYSIRNRKLKHY